MLRSIGWVAAGLVIVVLLGWAFTFVIADPASLESNSQILGRTSPRLLDLAAALATGTAGAFAMCRRDLSAVLPGVAISISLVPPLGVVGVCAGQGEWDAAAGALFLFLSNVFALVVAGTIVFTMSGYAREPGSSRTANRRRAYIVVTILTIVVVLPLIANTIYTVLHARWSVEIGAAAETWLADEDRAQVEDVTWNGLVATIVVTDPDGTVPPVDDLSEALSGLPETVSVVVDVGVGDEIPVR